jgi:Holliday junction resolvase RusA-like endonuclease
MKIVVGLPWEKDLSVNHMRYGAQGGYRKKPHVQRWMNDQAFNIRCSNFMGAWEPPLKIKIDFRWPTAHRRDKSNYHKAISDTVQLALGIDDRHFDIEDGEGWVDKDNPGFTVTIEDAG